MHVLCTCHVVQVTCLLHLPEVQVPPQLRQLANQSPQSLVMLLRHLTLLALQLRPVGFIPRGSGRCGSNRRPRCRLVQEAGDTRRSVHSASRIDPSRTHIITHTHHDAPSGIQAGSEHRFAHSRDVSRGPALDPSCTLESQLNRDESQLHSRCAAGLDVAAWFPLSHRP